MMQYTKYTYIILHTYVISSGYSYLNLHQPTIVNISKHHEPYGYVVHLQTSSIKQQQTPLIWWELGGF